MKRSYFCIVCIAFVVLVVSTLVTPVFAAKSVTPIEGVLVTDSVGNGSVSGTTVTITAKGGSLSRTTNTVTIKNTSGSTAQISFDYQVSGNYNSHTFPATSGTITQVLTAGQEVTYKIESQALKRTATLTLKNFSLAEAISDSKVTVTYGSLGSVKLDETSVVSGSSVSVNPTDGATFVAVPSNGAKFIGWINTSDKKVISTDASYTIYPVQDVSIKAILLCIQMCQS